MIIKFQQMIDFLFYSTNLKKSEILVKFIQMTIPDDYIVMK